MGEQRKRGPSPSQAWKLDLIVLRHSILGNTVGQRFSVIWEILKVSFPGPKREWRGAEGSL